MKEKVTILIKAFERPYCLTRLVKSIRFFYPTVKIIIVDDSMDELDHDFDDQCSYYRLEPNSGLSAGRNYGVNLVDTPYVLILDDDFLFTEKTRIEEMISTLEQGFFSIVGGEVWDYGIYNRQYAGTLEKVDGFLRQIVSKRRSSFQGLPAYDIILNFFLARVDILKKIPWDENIKIGCEHIEFFLRYKKESVKICVNKKIKVDHYPESSLIYNPIKNDYAHYMEYLLKKHELKAIEVVYPLNLKLLMFTQKKILNFYKFVSSRFY